MGDIGVFSILCDMEEENEERHRAEEEK